MPLELKYHRGERGERRDNSFKTKRVLCGLCDLRDDILFFIYQA